MNSPFYLRAGDVVLWQRQACRILSVNESCAVVAVPRDPRTFTTIMGKTVTIQPAPKRERISPNSELPILNRNTP